MVPIENHPLYGRHTIDTAMNSMWEFYKSRFLSLFLISLGMSLIMQFASTLVNIKELQSITDPVLLLEKLSVIIIPIMIIMLINLLLSAILQYFVIFNPMDKSNNILVSILQGIKYYIPFLILMVIFSVAACVAIAAGLVALIIGVFFSMLYLAMLYLFILPVLLIEGPNISGAITSIVRLAHRNFWSNIGWTAVFLILFVVISLILSGIILLPFSGSFFKSIFNPEEGSAIADITTKPLFLVLSALVNAVTLPLIPIFSCILYFNSRATQEEIRNARKQEPERPVRVEDLYARPYSEDHPDNPDNQISKE